jgi:hypothetical protein
MLGRKGQGRAPRRGRTPRRLPGRRPLLERLEDRLVPASLSYSSYLPGPAYAVAVNSAGEAFVTGATSTNAYGTGSAYVARLNAAGTGVAYLTYLGGSGYSTAGGIALDGAGNAYVVGWTNSTTFPTTSNAAFSASAAFPAGNTEAGFVTELSPTGSVLYSTYLPGGELGTFNSPGGAIAVDASDTISVTGAAGPGLPTTANAFRTAYVGGTNGEAYLAQINPALSGPSALLYASYLGGSGGDAGSAIAVDSAGNVYLAGSTISTNFPTTTAAFQRTLGGGWDAFVAKFNPALSGAASLVYSTYLGGSGFDGYKSDNPAAINVIQSGPGLAVDGAGDAYVVGSTTSTNFPTTPGAFQTSLHKSKLTRSTVDAFVTKLNSTGTKLVYSTYLGGSNLDGASAVALDTAGNAYVTGWTQSTDFPTLNPIQAQKASGTDGWGYPNSDVFVTTLNSTGTGLLFSTYFGGSSDDYGQGIALDSSGNTYVAGQTLGSGFPTTPGAYQTTPGGGIVFKIDPPVGGAEAAVPEHRRSPAAATRPTHPAAPTRADIDVLFALLSDSTTRKKAAGRQA